VKYGCLNLLNDPAGCQSAKPYGNSYFILKPEIKNRSSFVASDSSNRQPHICTFDYFSQLFLYIEVETINAINLIIKNLNKKDSQKIEKIDFVKNYYKYIEVQLHGNIILNRDVQEVRLHISDANPDIMKHLENQQIKFSVFY
jgi:hypothetical protein